MKNVNFKKIKELCAKGAILLMLTGTITTVTTPNTIYTVSAATKTLKSTKSSALKKLLAAYNSYDKSNYYSTQYKSITKYYNTGVTKINACKTKNDVSKMLDTYKKKMAAVKDKKTVLAEYKIKMQKSLLEYYKDLIKNNNYDSNGLKELESIYNTYNSKINKTTTKTKAKKYKNTAISKMENVVTAIMTIDGVKVITKEQVDKKVRTLCEKYPCYTEDEIRTLYVTINMTEFNFDLYEYLDVSTKEEMETKAALLEDILENMYLTTYQHYNKVANKLSLETEIKYEDIIYLPDFIENFEIKNESIKLCTLIYNMANIYTEQGQAYEGKNKLKIDSTATAFAYFYDYYAGKAYNYVSECIPKYSINSYECKNRSDLQIVNIFFIKCLNPFMLDWRYYQLYPPTISSNIYDDKKTYLQQNLNPIYKKIEYQYVLK